MNDVFISYANQDRAKARELEAALEANGWTVWWDREIPPGRTFDEVIEHTLGSARSVIVLWSTHSVASRWVRAEASAAAERGVLVPAMLEHVSIPLEFRRIQAADLVNWQGDHDDPELQKLLSTVAALVKMPATESPPQRKPQVQKARKGALWLRFAAVAIAGVLVGAALVYGLRPASNAGVDGGGTTPPDSRTEAVESSASRADAPPRAEAVSTPASDSRIDLLSAKNGGHLVRAPHENWMEPIDGFENWNYITGNEAVYAFKDNQPATFDTFRMLITETRGWNIKQFELLAANDAPDGQFRSLGTFETENVRLFPSPWQEFMLAPTRARYLKVRVLSLHQPSGATQVEQWQLLGSF